MIFIFKIFSRKANDEKSSLKAANMITCFYSLNPIFIYLTVRGSIEGITMALGAIFWYLYVGGNCSGNMSPVEKLDK